MEQKNQVIQNITNKNVLFFDMDGTLVDTNHVNFLSYKKAIETITKLEYNLIYYADKRFDRSALKNLASNLNETDYEKIIQEKENYYIEYLPQTNLIKETSDILFKYSKTNKTVLVTNCREERALMTLNHHKISNMFNSVFCRQKTDNGNRINKYANALRILNISPELVIVFENEQIEINDAVIAGINKLNIIKI
jgi:beta-phosphoglucomutase